MRGTTFTAHKNLLTKNSFPPRRSLIFRPKSCENHWVFAQDYRNVRKRDIKIISIYLATQQIINQNLKECNKFRFINNIIRFIARFCFVTLAFRILLQRTTSYGSRFVIIRD